MAAASPSLRDDLVKSLVDVVAFQVVGDGANPSLESIIYSLSALFFGLVTLAIDLENLKSKRGKSQSWSTYAFKFTNISFGFTLLYLLISALDALTLKKVFRAPRRWSLYLSLVLALSVDVGYFVMIFPKRVFGSEKSSYAAGASLLSPISAHKHLINLLWIIGESGAHNEPIYPVEFILFAIVIPFIICAFYYRLASNIKDPVQGEKLLRELGIPMPAREGEEEMMNRRWSKRRSILRPGKWINNSFKQKKMRTAFLLSPLLYGPIAAAILILVRRVMLQNAVLRKFWLIMTWILTPILYGRKLLIKFHGKNMIKDLRKLLKRVETWYAHFQKKRAPVISKQVQEGLNTVHTAIRETVQMIASDLRELAMEAWLTHMQKKP